MPTLTPVTNPATIPNSGSRAFTNQFATIAKINFFRIQNEEINTAYQNLLLYTVNKTSRNKEKNTKKTKKSKKSKKECGCKK
jgi:hypothetical protein